MRQVDKGTWLGNHKQREKGMSEGTTIKQTICGHCKKNRVNRPRGLCWSCYYRPGVKELFPSTSKYARRGIGNFTGNAPLPTFATSALPGSEEKIALLSERARLKQSLWHPQDMRLHDCLHGLKLLGEGSKEHHSGAKKFRKPLLEDCST
jgi:hypothetical protein